MSITVEDIHCFFYIYHVASLTSKGICMVLRHCTLHLYQDIYSNPNEINRVFMEIILAFLIPPCGTWVLMPRSILYECEIRPTLKRQSNKACSHPMWGHCHLNCLCSLLDDPLYLIGV